MYNCGLTNKDKLVEFKEKWDFDFKNETFNNMRWYINGEKNIVDTGI